MKQILCLAVFSTVWSLASLGQTLYKDGFETSLAGWSAQGGWSRSAQTAYEGAYAANDSPNAYYDNNQDVSLILASPLDFTGLSRPAVSFFHRYALEDGYDFGSVEASSNGTDWVTLVRYSGNQGTWAYDQLEVPAFAGVPGFRLRFRLLTDGSIVKDGWCVDAVAVGETPAAPVLSIQAVTNPPGVALSWPAMSGVAQYRVLRSTASNANWRLATQVGWVDGAATNYLDITVNPKTTYFYRLLAFTSDRLFSTSAEQAVTTPVTMDYPFLDTGEGGVARWNADPPWALSTEAAASPDHAWTDSEGGPYGHNLNSALTLARRLDLRGLRAPGLTFRHQWAFDAGDLGLVEVSGNNGADWSELARYTAGVSTGAWTWQRFSLESLTNSGQVLIRFRLTSNSSVALDGWHLDDIAVAEMPEAVPTPVLDQVSSSSIRVSWPASATDQFSHYLVYRSTSPGVSLTATLAGVVTNRLNPVWVDRGLTLDTPYYYKVYAVSRYGALSPEGGELGARTLNNPLPFSESFEGALTNWQVTGRWGTGANEPWSGRHLADSPDSSYLPSGDTFALASLDLRSTVWPVLRFRDRFALGAGDWLALEISPDGYTWTRVYGFYDSTRTNWEEQVVDLSPWKGHANVRARFHLVSDAPAETVGDGWAIDDVRAEELARDPVPYPFLESFESGFGSRWIHAGWSVRTNEAFEGSRAAWDTFESRGNDSVLHWMMPAGEIDLTNAVNPQLTLWVKAQISYYGYFRVHVSEDGVNWSELSTVNVNNDINSDWMRKQADLTPWAGKKIRLRFQSSVYYFLLSDIRVDRIVVAERPAGVLLQEPVPGLKSVDLSWTTATNGAGFLRYELYRSTDASVDLGDTKIAAFSMLSSNTFTDTGLSIGQTYYYGIFVVDTNHVYSAVSMRAATTVPKALPLVDPMDDLANWDSTGNWGVDTFVTETGEPTIGDSPGGSYEASRDTYIQTSVDLRGMTWPVLRFRDRFALGGGDWMRVMVSPDGGNWTFVYGLYESTRTNWEEQVVDLSPWKGNPNVRVRFHMVSDGNPGTVSEGWNLNRLRIEELERVPTAYPYFESFENGFGSNWLHAGWSVRTNDVFEGSRAAWDTFESRGYDSVQHWMMPAGEIDLTNAVNPQLTFWIKAQISYHGYFRVHVSEDGINWAELSAVNVNYDINSDWMRKQADLTPWAGRKIRLRFYSAVYYHLYSDMRVDRIVVADRPTGAALLPPVPSLKSVDLNWTPASNGLAFLRYELYRSPDATVDLNDTRIATFADPATNAFTDTGLNIGQTYYYGLFVVDTNHAYSTVSMRPATTVPKALPLDDPLDDLSNWDSTGSWGRDTVVTREGQPTLGDSPGGVYIHSSDSYIQTAVDLRSRTWPVLRFRDRFALGGGDWIRVEVSPDGYTWYYRYGFYESIRTNWEEQVLDLSPWKGNDNVRIRFRIVSDSNPGTVAEGWNLDTLRVEELEQVPVPYPFYEGFENNFGSNWLHAGWSVRTNDVFEGARAAWDTFESRGYDSVEHWMMPAGELDLAGAVNPQVTFYVKAQIGYYGYFRVYVSENGIAWTELSAVNVNNDIDSPWVRKQADLTPWAGKKIRLRFHSAVYWTLYSDIRVDRIVVSERPQGVSLLAPAPALKSVDLAWTAASNGAAFLRYELYRSPDPTVDLADTRIATFADPGATAFTDTGLSVGQTYYYGIFVVDTNHCYSTVSYRPVTTVPIILPFRDAMDNLANWDVTGGDWGADGSLLRDGAATISDSPGGSYTHNRDTWIQTCVDLRGATWPVLRFWDRFALGGGDWIRVEVSADGYNWTYPYGFYESVRTNWEEQVVDLSPWKGRDNVRLRFRMAADNNASTVSEGWNLDGLSVEELEQAVIPYPFYEDFETGFGSNWLHAGWSLSTNDVFEGQWAAWDSFNSRGMDSVQHWMMPAGVIDLTNAVSPQLVFWVKPQIAYYGYFRVHVSEDGITWTELSAVNINNDVDAPWTKKVVSLSPWVNRRIRVRFHSAVYYNIQSDIRVDRIGIGGTTPGTPVPRSPIRGESTPMSLPLLTVRNAVDFQGDPLTYQFEVFGDSNLTAKVAEVPAVAENAAGTSWRVDVELANNRQYWWRCRVSDGGTTGAWSQAATFFVNRANLPPGAPGLSAPTDRASAYRAPETLFIWTPSMETQAEDRVTAYQVEFASDPAFTAPVAEAVIDPLGLGLEAHALAELAPTNLFELDRWYYWRVRGRDAWNTWSDWSRTNQVIWAAPPAGGPEPAPDYPLIRLSVDHLDAACREGENPGALAFSLQNSGGGVLNYTVEDDAPWLSVEPAAGSSIGEWDPVVIQFNATGLAGGIHTGTVWVLSGTASNAPQGLRVILDVTPVSVSDAPQPLEPAADASLDPTGRVAFAWTPVARASNYVLSVSREGGGWSTNVTADACALDLEAEWAPGAYVWQARGVNERGPGPLSASRMVYVGVSNTLEVVTPLGNPQPSEGLNRFRRGTVVTASVDAVVVDGFTTYTCTGWTGLGGIPASGASNRFVCAVTQDAVLAWMWSTSTVSPSAVALSAETLEASTQEGDNAPNGQVGVRNGGVGTLNWRAESEAWWITPVPASGSSTGEWDTITLVYRVDPLLHGTYTGRVIVSDPAVPIPAQTVTVTAVVRPNQLPARPAPVSPAEGDLLPVTGAVRFAWTPATRALDYHLWVGKDGAAFTNLLTGGTGANRTLEALFHRGLYTWFVMGVNQLGEGQWSTTATFRVERMMWPEGGQPAGQGVAGFAWTPTPGVAQYQVALERYQTNGTGAWVTMATQDVSEAQWIPTGLAFPDGSYRWRLREGAGGTWGEFEPMRLFQVGVPATPAPVSPTGSGYLYKAVPFAWTPAAEAVSYQVQLMKGTAVFTNTPWMTSTQAMMRLASAAAAYTWRVRALNAAGPGAWSEPMAYAFKKLAAPKLTAPVRNAAVGTRPAFRWNPSAGASAYTLTVVNGATGVKKIYKTGATTYQPPTALARGSYSWTVIASNADQKSAASAKATFTVR